MTIFVLLIFKPHSFLPILNYDIFFRSPFLFFGTD